MSYSKHVTSSTSYPMTNKCGPAGSYSLITRDYSSTSERTPGWPVIPAPDNPYTMSLIRRQRKYQTYKNDYNPNNDCERVQTRIIEAFGYSLDDYLPPPCDARPKADGTARLRAKDQSANWAVNIAEIGQTYRLALLTLNRLTSAVRGIVTRNPAMVLRAFALRPADMKRVRHQIPLSAVPEFWLEVQYGWKPLLSDVKSALDGATSRIALGGPVFKVEGNGVERVVKGPYQWLDTGAFKIMATKTIVSLAKTRLMFALDSQQISALTSIGLTNPYSLAWELVPFSFVVDWFLPVGDFLSGIDACDNLTFIRGTRSQLSRTKAEYQYLPGYLIGGGRQMSSGGNDLSFMTTFTRDVLSTFPRNPRPQFKNPFSPTHLANALALFAGAFKGH